MEENKVIEGYENKEEVEVRTVYVKEKSRTGWWKIVMMVIAILILICFGLTAAFTGIGAAQLQKIAEKEVVPMPAPGMPAPGGEQIGEKEGDEKTIDDFTLGDLFSYFGQNSDESSQAPSTNDNGNSNDSGNSDQVTGEPETSEEIGNLFNWFSDLFGTGENQEITS